MNPKTYIQHNLRYWTSKVKNLREQGKLNTALEVAIDNLTFEELIAVKLELSFRTLSSPLFGIPIWQHIDDIIKDAVLSAAISVTETRSECARFLGITLAQLHKEIEHHKIYLFNDPMRNIEIKNYKARRDKWRAKQAEKIREFDSKHSYEIPDDS